MILMMELELIIVLNLYYHLVKQRLSLSLQSFSLGENLLRFSLLLCRYRDCIANLESQ